MSKMSKPDGWDGAKSAKDGGGAKDVPPGVHVCVITDVSHGPSKAGNERLALSLDIAEGPHEGHYGKQGYRRAMYFQLTGRTKEGKTDEKSLTRFKTLIETIEESNPGFKWDWEPHKLMGLLAAFAFEEVEEEYGGKTHARCKPRRPVPLEQAREGKEEAGGGGGCDEGDAPHM